MNARRLLPLLGLSTIAVALVAVWSTQGTGQPKPRLVLRPYDVGDVDFGTPVPAGPDAVSAGKTVYGRNCSRCHGTDGKGDGPIAYVMNPAPRDFSRGSYKFRTTESGQLPTDQDLYQVVTLGLPGSGMPPWKGKLSQTERWQLVHYLKSLYAKWDEDAKANAPTPITIPKPIPASADSVAKGKDVYKLMKCWECHGEQGRGDGQKAADLKDDWGNPIKPGNLTKAWFFRGGSNPEDVYRTFMTGVNGTPMPSFADSIANEADRWHLVNFVLSLAKGRPPEPVVVEPLKGPTLGVVAFQKAAKLGSAAGKPQVVIDVVASGWEMWIMKDGKYLPRVPGLGQAGHEIRVKRGQVVQVNFWPTEDGLGRPWGHGFSIEGYDDILFGLHAAAGPTAPGSGAAYVEHPLAYRFVADRTGEFPYYCAVQCDPGQEDHIKKLTGLWGHTFMGGTFVVE
jgi:mono/diheme cytochrome c family protein